ncbi:PBECR4 domain-containing protein [Lactococcus lactis]|uniref:PBECR4 domain-containing protein n=1 Tax=Lactococcus lactis TaxID=1358 RepID=UPI0022608B6E|nr:PBECR4 domain-containing protein [Lactococcus lactis]MCX7531291.1 PBECR4 domain-containing protein [Lactococcus lactis]MDM7474798.1 PBECR4 domain-containing protein [Lactococcus lactis]
MEEKENKLKNAIEAIDYFENKRYEIVLGNSNKGQFSIEKTIVLEFSRENFFHLLGFQYISELNASSSNKATFIKLITKHLKKKNSLIDNDSCKKILSSTLFSQIENRLELFSELKDCIELKPNKNNYWERDETFDTHTDIDWEYLIEFLPHNDPNFRKKYLFIKKDEHSDKFIPLSLFKTDDLRFSNNQARKDILALKTFLYNA